MSSTWNIFHCNSGYNVTSRCGHDFMHQLIMSKESIKEPGNDRFNEFNLTYFQSLLLSTVLEDTLTQLKVLAECNNILRVAKTNSDMSMLLAHKFAITQPSTSDELDGIDQHKLGGIEYKLKKLEDDRKHVGDVIFGTYMDLSIDRCFSYMSQDVNVMIDRVLNLEILIEEEAKNRVQRRDLYRQIRHMRNHIKSVDYETNSVIENLKTNAEDTGLHTSIRSRYVDNWEIARTEQHHQTIYDKEAKPLETIMYYKRRTDQEHRIHTEIELLTNISINDNLSKIEDWMAKYDKDMEALDIKIQKTRNKLEDMRKKTQALEETIEHHDILCKDWISFKEERERQRLYREKMQNAAIAIQAWWRGLLVRNQLGPYKVAKKPTGANKKKK